MARGGRAGKKRTQYVRDNSGRFASTPGGGPSKATPASVRKAAKAAAIKGGTLQFRTSLRRSKAKLAVVDKADETLKTALSRRAQKGAVTRGKKKLAQAIKSSQARLSVAPKSSIVKKKRKTPQPVLQSVKDVAPRVSGGRGEGRIKGSAKPKVVTQKAIANSKKTDIKSIDNASKQQKLRLPRKPTPNGVIRKSDFDKIKSDRQKGIGTPFSRAGQRAIDRSAREAVLVRRQSLDRAKRSGATGLGKGPLMNESAIKSRDFAWNRNEQPATVSERLTMWRRSERRIRRAFANLGASKSYYGELRASRRAEDLVKTNSRLGDLPTTRKMADQPRERRKDRISKNETQGKLASYEANKSILPQIQKLENIVKQRVAEGKKVTPAQREKHRKLVDQYNKLTRKLRVSQAAKSYMDNPWGFNPKSMK
jgi:hypothetical protein